MIVEILFFSSPSIAKLNYKLNLFLEIGYLCKQVLKKKEYKNCPYCKEGLTHREIKTPVNQLVDIKSRGRLIHANTHFFNLISYVEKYFSKYARDSHVFNLTIDQVIENYKFTFPYKQHGADILSYSIYYYVRLRMRQFTFQENQKVKKESVVKRKLSKLTNV